MLFLEILLQVYLTLFFISLGFDVYDFYKLTEPIDDPDMSDEAVEQINDLKYYLSNWQDYINKDLVTVSRLPKYLIALLVSTCSKLKWDTPKNYVTYGDSFTSIEISVDAIMDRKTPDTIRKMLRGSLPHYRQRLSNAYVKIEGNVRFNTITGIEDKFEDMLETVDSII